ncbi:uncharacterized protein LOC142988205 isoform X2 [Genypterus blacodes]|uniref:uncharacterized protein LOC142988205 isoform X2 n=1 Tax=Genypterus blacodes TaxID=154954 RepID=UPI003F776CEA
METREDADLQPLTLSDPCRLRVAAARAFAVVKNRDVAGFEGVMRFLEATHTLLPRLVPPIKHMKIVFGLKTLVIMGMLQAGRSAVDTVLRTIQFFPSNLPQYQDQCNQHQMFLMRKNHLEFKELAQTLAIDKSKLDLYFKTQMEQQYGEHYAQKLEDRLLHYLHQLEALLPQETGNDKRRLGIGLHADREEKLFLDTITSDPTGVRRHAASCGLLPAEEPGPPGGLQEVTDVHGQAEEDGQTPESKLGEHKGAKRPEEAASSPQFCSKHRRWVRSILWACPDDQLLLQAGQSPPLFRSSSSSSTSSSLDLTPSGLVPPPASHSDPRPQVPEGENLSSGSPVCLHHTQVTGTSSNREGHGPSPDPLTVSSVSQQGSRSHPPHTHSPSCPAPSTHTCSRLSTKFRRASPQFLPNPSLEPFGEGMMSWSGVLRRPQDFKPPSDQTLLPVRPQASCSARPHPHTCGRSFQPGALLAGGSAARLRLSPHSQVALLRSKLLQPHVRLTRLSETEAPPSLGPLQSEEEGGDDHDSSALSSSSFDVNTLYSSSSSSSVGEDVTDSDLDYKPVVRKKRLRPQSATAVREHLCLHGW